MSELIPDFLRPSPKVDPTIPIPAPPPPPSPFCEWTTRSRFHNNQWWAVICATPLIQRDILVEFRTAEECEKILDHLIAGTIHEDTQQVIEGYRAHILVRPFPFKDLLSKPN